MLQLKTVESRRKRKGMEAEKKRPTDANQNHAGPASPLKSRQPSTAPTLRKAYLENIAYELRLRKLQAESGHESEVEKLLTIRAELSADTPPVNTSRELLENVDSSPHSGNRLLTCR